jgi:hypothetical protein
MVGIVPSWNPLAAKTGATPDWESKSLADEIFLSLWIIWSPRSLQFDGREEGCFADAISSLLVSTMV